MFAIVVIAGKQYHVSPGDILTVDRIAGDVGKTITFDQVLLWNDADKTKIGTPTVPGALVKVKIIAQQKGDKVEVFRFKSKVRYRRHTGFRHSETKIEILDIT